MSKQPADNTGFLRTWGLVLGLVAVLALELGLFLGLRRGTAELEQSFAAGSPLERITALHVLRHRDRPLVLDRELVEQLLASSDSLMAEFLMVEGVVRERDTELRQRLYCYVSEQPSDERLRTRCRFLLEKAKGLEPVRRFLEACETIPAPCGR